MTWKQNQEWSHSIPLYMLRKSKKTIYIYISRHGSTNISHSHENIENIIKLSPAFFPKQFKCVYACVRVKIYCSWYGIAVARRFIICTHPQISLGRSSQGEWRGQGMWHALERRDKGTRFWWESPKERDHSGDQGVDERMESEWIWRLAGGVEWIKLAQDRDR
jgi:hypothetical protein